MLASEIPLWVREVPCETTRSRAAVRTEVRRRFHDGTGNWSAQGGGGAALPQCPVCSWFFIFREAAEKVARGFTMVVEVVGRAWAHARGSTTALLPLHFGRLRSVTARRGALRTHTLLSASTYPHSSDYLSESLLLTIMLHIATVCLCLIPTE